MAAMTFEVSGSIGGRLQRRSSDTAIGAAGWADKFHKLGAMPVLIKMNGLVIENAEEFERLVSEERKALSALRS